VLAAAQAPLITLTAAAVARNKVEGLAWPKILGLLPTRIAPAMGWLPDPARWPLRALPHYWAVDSLSHPTALATAMPARQTLRRLNAG
jgi:hypothetical protein